jgi:hypothetical protein
MIRKDFSAQTNGKPEVERKRFRTKLYLRIMANKTLRPVARKELSTLGFTIEFEYPEYSEELDAKKNATTYDEVRGIHYVDNDVISEWRIKRCLIRWNLHLRLKGFCKRVSKYNKMLTDESWEDFKRLPPLVRKAIINKLWRSLGGP